MMVVEGRDKTREMKEDKNRVRGECQRSDSESLGLLENQFPSLINLDRSPSCVKALTQRFMQLQALKHTKYRIAGQ
jgi:hypothetical protein